MDDIDRLVRCALGRLHNAGECTDCAEPDMTIPPTVETSLAGFVHQQPSEGGTP